MVLRTVFKNADSPRPPATLADDLARAGYMDVDDLELSSESREMASRKTSPAARKTSLDASVVSRQRRHYDSERGTHVVPDRIMLRPMRLAGLLVVLASIHRHAIGSPSPRRSRRLTSTLQSDCSVSTIDLSSDVKDVVKTTASKSSSRISSTLDLAGTYTAVPASSPSRRILRRKAARSSFHYSLMIELENANDDDVFGLDDDVVSQHLGNLVLVAWVRPLEPASGVSSSRQSAADAPPASAPPSQASRDVPVVHSESSVETPVSNVSTGFEPSVSLIPASSQVLDASGHGSQPLGLPLPSLLPHPRVGRKPRKKAKVTALVVSSTNAIVRQAQLSESSPVSLAVWSQTRRKSSKKGRAKAGAGSRRASSSRDVVTPNTPSAAITLLPLVPRSSSILRFTRPVSKWARPYVSPVFSLRGALTSCTRILSCRQPAPVPKKAKVPCAGGTAIFIAPHPLLQEGPGELGQ
ncbi:hypothetical protein PHYPSEUDO_003299 [Phytophthora pseudosyringae]|uniref:Uncharacterized protein n=1 Tax=Phytophthora pseudosyringae TaxID=221518 RepID=A0A8T1VS84_9STRA|nr:hypothetical protein PHYPSEUDO_003299 [Phytophthora pseudosyringae]